MRTARYSDSGGLPGTETPHPLEGTYDQAARQEMTSYRDTPQMYRMTDASENITLPQTSFTGGNEKMAQ